MASSEVLIAAALVLIATNLQPASPNDPLLNWCDESSYIQTPEYVKLAARITAQKQFGDSTCYVYIQDASRNISIEGAYPEGSSHEDHGFSADIEKARAICRSYEATLPTIDSHQENRLLCDFMISQTRDGIPVSAPMGLIETKLGDTSTWIWEDETPVQEWWELDTLYTCFRDVKLRPGDPYYFELVAENSAVIGKRCLWWRCASYLTVKPAPYSLFCKKRFTPSTATPTTTTRPTAVATTTPTPAMSISLTSSTATASSTTTMSTTTNSTTNTPSDPVNRVGEPSHPPPQASEGPKIAPSFVVVVTVLVGAVHGFKTLYEWKQKMQVV